MKIVDKPPRVRKYEQIIDQVLKLNPKRALAIPVDDWTDDKLNRFKVGLRVESRRRKVKIHMFTRNNQVYVYK